MEEFWNAIDDVPPKHSSSAIYQEPRHHLKVEFLEIPLGEIIKATNDFSEECRIGSGGYADVYRAELNILEDIQRLPSNIERKCKEEPLKKKKKTVAIKRITKRPDDQDKEEQGKDGFSMEIKLLTSCKHPNVVSLLGFCEENDELILVYEYAVNGSLGDYMERMSNGEVVNLTWGKRLQICLDIAHGINYLHADMPGKPSILHRDIKSDNILLDENLNAKVSDFGLSKFHPVKQLAAKTMVTVNIVGTEVYMDPQYWQTYKYKLNTDIYSLGVVLFEILCGRWADDLIYIRINRFGLAPIARACYKKGTLSELIDSKLIEEVPSRLFTLNRGSNEDPFETFSKIACQCVAETQNERPTMETLIMELQNALNLEDFKNANNSFSTILSATKNFSDENLIAESAFGKVYKGQLPWKGNSPVNFTVRRFGCEYGLGEEFQMEISMLKSLKHRNIISVLGHYDENDEKIIIYEQAVHGTLYQHLSDANLTWSKRLQICLDVARALDCIHEFGVTHCDINSSKIFLSGYWEPKIYGFELSTKYPQSSRHCLLYSRYFGTKTLTPKYDVYCFGVLLLEVLCGRKPVISIDGHVEEDLEEIMDHDLRKQIDTQAFTRFTSISYKCLNEQPVMRPTMEQIIKELEELIQIQRELDDFEYPEAADEDTSSNTLKMDFLKIPLSEIMEATNNFNESYKVGSGAFGITYKAELEVLDIQCLSSIEGGECREKSLKIRKSVAIKRIYSRLDEQGVQGFFAEVKLLSSCKHPNIVGLLGFSIENNEHVLIYEYALNGSLRSYLESIGKVANLTWVQRIQICLDIANGINYLHTNMEGKPRIIHRDIKSDNILLDENLNAKVGDFGLSHLQHRDQGNSTIHTKHYAGTTFYIDPEYWTTGRFKKESDTYSFGVVLFEILSGRMAYDQTYLRENEMGLAPIARRRFREGTVNELVDPKMMEMESDDLTFTINKRLNRDSFEVFTNLAYRCLAQTQADRPRMEYVINELQKALHFQEMLQREHMVLFRFQLSDIELATENFAETHRISSDTNGNVYKAELDQLDYNSLLATKGKNSIGEPSKKRITAAIKRVTNRIGAQGKEGFLAELEMRADKHPNVVFLLGFCDKGDEMILVYEHASNRTLDDYFKSVDDMVDFTWTRRLHMCLEIAYGLQHLDSKMVNQSIIRSDITSSNILLNRNGKAKIGYFMISNLQPENQEICKKVYEDPEYEVTRKPEGKSGIYSFGVVLFEIFCGRVAYDPVYIAENNKGLAPIARQFYNDGTIMRIMDPKLKQETDEEISTSNEGYNQDSLDTFLKIAYRCLEEAAKRPTIEIIINELKRALKLQEAKGVKLR